MFAVLWSVLEALMLFVAVGVVTIRLRRRWRQQVAMVARRDAGQALDAIPARHSTSADNRGEPRQPALTHRAAAEPSIGWWEHASDEWAGSRPVAHK